MFCTLRFVPHKSESSPYHHDASFHRRIIACRSYLPWKFCFCPRGVVHALGCSPLLEENAVNYLLWLLPGLFFLFVECVGMMLIRLDGAPKVCHDYSDCGCGRQYRTRLVHGVPAGLASDWCGIGHIDSPCAVGGTMVFAYFFRFADKLRFYPLKRTVTSLLLTLRNTGYMVRIGFATFLTELAMSVMMLTGNYMFISMLGEEGLAAFAIACYLFPVVFSISNAVAQSAQPIISFNYGAHLLHRVSRALSISVQSVEKAMASIVYTLLRAYCSLCRASACYHGHSVSRPMARHSGCGTADLCRYLYNVYQT